MKHLLIAASALTLASCTLEVAPPDTTPTPATIPVALHGEWGLTALDCVSINGDNKGMITVDAASVKFYESRAVLATASAITTTSVTGVFNFTGEGQTWTRAMSLRLAGATQLVRSESGPGAMTQPLTYTKCP